MDNVIDQVVRAIAAQDAVAAAASLEDRSNDQSDGDGRNNNDEGTDYNKESDGADNFSNRRAAAEEIAGHTLFVLLSDHGMTESGNHGGASKDETNSVLAMFPVSARVSICNVSCLCSCLYNCLCTFL